MIEIRNLTKTKVPSGFVRNARKTFLLLKIPKGVEVSVVFAPPSLMRALNRRYRKKDTPTDVLSFGLSPLERRRVFGTGRGMLGEIFIAPSIAKKDSRNRGIAFHQQLIPSTSRMARRTMEVKGKSRKLKQRRDAERVEALILLLVHGIVHILGYEHDGAASARRMERLEKRILRKISS